MSVVTQWQGEPINPALPQFLSLVAFSEGTDTGLDDGYGVIVSGVDGAHTFTDYSAHPFAAGRPPIVVRENPPLHSTASGRYQLILPTWHYLQSKLRLLDFSPLSQDLAALELIHERGAVLDIEQGEVELAIQICSNIWASFPGNNYQQGGKRMETLLAKWAALTA